MARATGGRTDGRRRSSTRWTTDPGRLGVMRLEITRRADLAVQTMAVLGQASARLKAQELADALCSTPAFVPQVVGPLVKAGWVRSDPGPTGGYVLAVPLDELSVLDVIEAVDGPTDTGRCVVVEGACDRDHPCVLHDAWTRARGELIATLGSMPMSSISPDRLSRTHETP